MPLEMLKAQAIVARTYAAYHRRLNAEKSFHLVASTLNQQYVGRVPRRFAGVDRGEGDRGPGAAVAGRAVPRLLPHRQRRLHRGPARRLRGREHAGAQAGPRRVPFATRRISAGASICRSPISRRAPAAAGVSVGRVVALDVLERSASLRVARIAVRGTAGTVTLRGNDLRRLVGLRHAQEHALRGGGGGPVARFVGRGYGHGVGLDQWSAKTMADQGYTRPADRRLLLPGRGARHAARPRPLSPLAATGGRSPGTTSRAWTCAWAW